MCSRCSRCCRRFYATSTRTDELSDSTDSDEHSSEDEWNPDGKSGRSNESGGRLEHDGGGELRTGRGRSARRDESRRHTLSAEQQYMMTGQGGSLARTMDLEGQFRGYGPHSNALLFDDDPGIMSEVETSSTGFRRGAKQRSSLPVVRTPSKTLERPLGLVFLQYRNETKRSLLPNEITSIDTVKALFVRSFPKQLTMEYLDSPNVKIYIHDSSKDMFYELEDLRSHLREIRDRSVLRLFEAADVTGGLPMAGIGISSTASIAGGGHFDDPSYFSEPEFDSEYQHQHIHKSNKKGAPPYYMGSTASLPRGTALMRTYSPAVPNDRLKPLATGTPPKPQRAYSSTTSRSGRPMTGDRFAPFQRSNNSLYNIPDGYMSSPERSSRYEDPYYAQYAPRSGSITPVIDEEVSDTDLMDESYSLYGVKLPPPSGARPAPRAAFPSPAAPVPYDATRLRVENMERQLANLTGLVQKALTQTPTTHLQGPAIRESYRDDTYIRSSETKTPRLGRGGCHKSVSFEKSVSFSDEPPDLNSPKQHTPQHSERERLKPAPPPKPASLSPGQYDNRSMVYRDLQLTPEMYNQLRCLQKKAKDLRSDVRNLRRMSQAQAHYVKEVIRDTFIKIRATLVAGGEQIWQAGMDQERARLNREEDVYKQEMLRLETDLTGLEQTVEDLRGSVINRKTRVNMCDVENMALVLSKSSKTVAELKLRFPTLQDSLKNFLNNELEKVMHEEAFLKEEPDRLESALRRCKKLTGTLVTLKRLASVQEQRLPCGTLVQDGRLTPENETPPVTPSTPQSKATGDTVNDAGHQHARPENALDALLDELQTFSKPAPPVASSSSLMATPPPALPAKGAAHLSAELARKACNTTDISGTLPSLNHNTCGSLRRLHSYPSSSFESATTTDTPVQMHNAHGHVHPKPVLPIANSHNSSNKPPLPERGSDLTLMGKRVPPPPPPRTSSKSPLASPTSPTKSQQRQNDDDYPPQSNHKSGMGSLPRAHTLPRPTTGYSIDQQTPELRKDELETRHQELLRKQKALQEQYARLQQLQRGANTLSVIAPPSSGDLLKKTGSESNLLHKMGLQLSAAAPTCATGSLTNLPDSSAAKLNGNGPLHGATPPSVTTAKSTTPTNKVYETEIL